MNSLNAREALEKLDKISPTTPELTMIKLVLENQILLEDRIYFMEKKFGIK